METLQLALKYLVLVFVISSMATLGLSLPLKELLKPLRQPLLVIITLVVNFLVSPAIAYLLAKLLPIHESYETGLLLLSAAAGAPFLPKLVEAAKGEVTLSVSILLLQMAGSIALMPLTLPLLIPGMEADVLSIAMPLILQMLLPLIVGFMVQQFASRWTARLHSIMKMITSVSALGAILILLLTNMSDMLGTLGSGAGLLALGYVALVMVAGYLGGMMIQSSRVVHSLAAGQRNIAAALVIAASNHLDHQVMVMLIMSTFVGLIPLIGQALYFRRKSSR